MLRKIFVCSLLITTCWVWAQNNMTNVDSDDPVITAYVLDWSGCDAVVSVYLIEWSECDDIMWTTNPGKFQGCSIKDTLEMWINWRHLFGKKYPNQIPKDLYFCDSFKPFSLASNVITK